MLYFKPPPATPRALAARKRAVQEHTGNRVGARRDPTRRQAAVPAETGYSRPRGRAVRRRRRCWGTKVVEMEEEVEEAAEEAVVDRQRGVQLQVATGQRGRPS